MFLCIISHRLIMNIHKSFSTYYKLLIDLTCSVNK